MSDVEAPRRPNTPGARYERSLALLDRATAAVPSQTQTFSKGWTQFPRGVSPVFAVRADGGHVWDADGNRFIDWPMALGPLLLGHNHPSVNAALKAQLDDGIAFSLPTQGELELAERLIDWFAYAERVRFGKNGSDATTAAIRLARAHTGRDKVAVCGYHGWHDWYIATTARDLGVPRAVRDLSVSFAFNDAEALAALLAAEPGAFAAVILEPAGLDDPAAGFLEAVRALCDRFGVVLVFDEIVTGYRLALGGAQAHYGVTPDLASFGKALGNGMPISAIVGRRDIMRRMEDIFFSGTFGGETLSIAAALATLAVLEAEDAPARFARCGVRLREGARTIFADAGLDTAFTIKGPDWWPAILPRADAGTDPNLAASLLKQELVARGVLMGPTFNLCLAHDDESVIDETLIAVAGAAAAVAEALAGDDPARALRGKAMQPVFRVRPQTGAAR